MARVAISPVTQTPPASMRCGRPLSEGCPRPYGHTAVTLTRFIFKNKIADERLASGGGGRVDGHPALPWHPL